MPHHSQAPALRTPEELLAAQNLVLEMIATGRPLEEILCRIVELVEGQDPSALCCLYLVESYPPRFGLIVAPALGPEFVAGLRKLRAGEDGLGGHAIKRRERVVVEDLMASPLYDGMREFLLGHGLRSCWSVPIIHKEREALGALSIYHAEPFAPGATEIAAGENAARKAAIAVDRTQAERSLQERMEHFRALVESASDMICILDAKGAIRYANPAVEAALGYTPQEITGRHALDLAAPKDVDAAHAMLEAALQTPGASPPIERLYLHRNGANRVFEITINNQLADPVIDGVILTGRDITSRKAAEQELISSKESYRDLVENANDIVYTHDLSGRFTSLNKAGEIVTGYSRAEALERNIADFLAPDYRPLPAEMTRRQLGGESRATYELEIAGKHGVCALLEVSTRLIFDRGRPVGVQGIGRDVTEQRQYQRHVLQSQKMEAIGRLAGGVAHDFNNLLTVITGYTQWMLEILPADSLLVDNASEILLAASRGATLTNQLLSFSRSQRIEPILVDLNTMVTQLDQMLHRIIGEDIEISAVTSPDLWLIKADPGQVEQVILNLVVNARDAMPRGGRLTLSAANARVEAELPDRIPGDYVMLEVSDTGTGIDDAVKPHIFEPFFTTKEMGKGTGLGLSTVYGIVQHSGGWIDVESVEGAGARFRVYFPRAAGELQPLATSRHAAPLLGSETVLVVEDETAVRRLVAAMLTRFGYTVLDAADAAAASLLAVEHEGRIDLLLTDVVMPHVGGPELARQLRAEYPNLKVLFMSGYAHEPIVEPGAGYLPKPFQPDTLAAKVREILDSPA